jgi:uncharacterized protein YhfF
LDHLKHRRMQFVSDRLVQQVVDGIKTASVVRLGEIESRDGEYDDPLVVGECYWEEIPERLWRGETNRSADEFREDHLEYFQNSGPGFEFVAYYFELANGKNK